ncbi:hypothetical protein F0U61_43055 [Archangium violaceum]|uniref:hypothetical protein n=1 Tax=Archangium violaceum TaxID=83451 RepID=UPI002B2ACD8A|nr:hypothetical protein F0U61_43055 [Archangium violaceum]
MLLAVWVGVCSLSVWSIQHAGARWVPVAPKPQSKSSVSAHLPGRQEKLVGVREPSAQGQWELPRHTSKPPLHPRLDSRLGPALKPNSRLEARVRAHLSCVVPASHGRLADRPVVANCPAQGPPRTE